MYVDLKNLCQSIALKPDTLEKCSSGDKLIEIDLSDVNGLVKENNIRLGVNA